jgi:hypothetical protein
MTFEFVGALKSLETFREGSWSENSPQSLEMNASKTLNSKDGLFKSVNNFLYSFVHCVLKR